MKTLTQQQKKEFALSKIAPYFKNPELCGYDGENCLYLTGDGKKCVVGSCLIYPEIIGEEGINADDLLEKYGQEILIPEARNILTSDEWNYLQHIHDNIASNRASNIIIAINNLNLFTYEELKAYSETI